MGTEMCTFIKLCNAFSLSAYSGMYDNHKCLTLKECNSVGLYLKDGCESTPNQLVPIDILIKSGYWYCYEFPRISIEPKGKSMPPPRPTTQSNIKYWLATEIGEESERKYWVILALGNKTDYVFNNYPEFILSYDISVLGEKYKIIVNGSTYGSQYTHNVTLSESNCKWINSIDGLTLQKYN